MFIFLCFCVCFLSHSGRVKKGAKRNLPPKSALKEIPNRVKARPKWCHNWGQLLSIFNQKFHEFLHFSTHFGMIPSRLLSGESDFVSFPTNFSHNFDEFLSHRILPLNHRIQFHTYILRRSKKCFLQPKIINI